MSKRGKKKVKRKILKLFFILVLFMFFSIFSIILYSNITLQHLITADGSEEVVQGKKEYISALICGVNNSLTDTIMYIKYDVKYGKLFIMSIPRDTYVENEYCYANKLNSIYRGKNIVPLVKEIQELLDTEIDYYVIFDTELLNNLVDEIGGVKIEVPFEMKYDDPTQDLHIDLEPGVQVLNGKEAEEFVRFRHNNDMSIAYAMGDLGRIQTQQNFIKAFIKSLLSPKNIFKVKNIVDLVLEETETNITGDDIIRYMFDVIKLDTKYINTKTASGVPKYINGISYFFIDKKETQSNIENAF